MRFMRFMLKPTIIKLQVVHETITTTKTAANSNCTGDSVMPNYIPPEEV